MFIFTVANAKNYIGKLNEIFSSDTTIKDMIDSDLISFQSENIFSVWYDFDSLYIGILLNENNIPHYIDVE